MRRRSDTPKFIYITGCDGTGKSTQVKMILRSLADQGVCVRHLWLRYPNMISLPFLVFARLMGLSWREEGGGTVHGYWDFSSSWLMEKVYPWFLYLDTVIAAFFRVKLPLMLGWTIVCERFVLDILADLSLALGGKDVIAEAPGRLILDLLPTQSQVVILDLDEETLVARRPNLAFDHHLSQRLEIYRRLTDDLGLEVISSRQDVDTIYDRIVRMYKRT